MVWISTGQAAQLLSITPRAIRRAIDRNKLSHRYVDGVGRGGKRLEIALESLPEAAQARYYNELPPELEDTLDSYTFEQRHNAELRAYVVREYLESGMQVDEYLAWHNEAEPDIPITASQLFRWQRKYKASGGEIVSLVDRRGGYNREQSTIPPDVWQCFYNKYMTLQKRSIQRCWELTKIVYADIPHISSFKRKVSRIPYRAILKYREGHEAYKNSLPEPFPKK